MTPQFKQKIELDFSKEFDPTIDETKRETRSLHNLEISRILEQSEKASSPRSGSNGIQGMDVEIEI